MSGNLDDMLNMADDIEEQNKARGTINRAILSKERKIMRVRIVGKWGSAFDVWLRQAAVPGVPSDQVGGNRRLILKGWHKDKDTGEFIFHDPVTKHIFNLKDNGNTVEKAQFKDVSVRQFFVFNVVPKDLATGAPDPECIEGNHTKLLTTNKNGYGLTQMGFKAAAEVMKTQKMFNKDIGLSDLDLIFNRTGDGFDTEYGCQPVPGPQGDPGFDIKNIKTYDVEPLTTMSSYEEIYKITGWWFGEGQPPVIDGQSFQSSQSSQAAVPSGAAPVSRPAPAVVPKANPGPATMAVPSGPSATQPSSPATPAMTTPSVSTPATEEMIQAACPYCNTMHNVPASKIDDTQTCTGCGQPFQAPPF